MTLANTGNNDEQRLASAKGILEGLVGRLNALGYERWDTGHTTDGNACWYALFSPGGKSDAREQITLSTSIESDTTHISIMRIIPTDIPRKDNPEYTVAMQVKYAVTIHSGERSIEPPITYLSKIRDVFGRLSYEQAKRTPRANMSNLQALKLFGSEALQQVGLEAKVN